MSDDLVKLDEMLARRAAARVPRGRAKHEIMEASRAGKLTLSGDLTELRAAPPPFASAPPPIAHGRMPIPAEKLWHEWNWETNQAKLYVEGETVLLGYCNIGAPRAEFDALWAQKTKPSSKDLVTAKGKELAAGWAGTKKKLANHLSKWLEAEHPDAPPMSPKVVERYLPLMRRPCKATNPR